LTSSLSGWAMPPQAADYPSAKARAEELYARGAFELARREYASVDPAALPQAERRWVEFRRVDCAWRAANATAQTDTSVFDGCCAMVGSGSRPRNGGPTATVTSWPASAQARANGINGYRCP